MDPIKKIMEEDKILGKLRNSAYAKMVPLENTDNNVTKGTFGDVSTN